MHDLNFLSPTGFVLTVDKIDSVCFNCVEISIPSIQSTTSVISTPTINYTIPGYKLIYEPLACTFIVDEDMRNFQELSKWFLSMANHESLFNNDVYRRVNDYMSGITTNYSDASLQILTNNNNPNLELKFVDLFPISMSGISFKTSVDDLVYKVCHASFKISYLKNI